MEYKIEDKYAATEDKKVKTKTATAAEKVIVQTNEDNNVEVLLNQIDSKLDLLLAKQEGE